MSAALQAVHSVTTATPEARLIAAVIACALADASAGDVEALAWLHDHAPAWLSLIVPEHVDAAEMHQALIAYLREGKPG